MIHFVCLTGTSTLNEQTQIVNDGTEKPSVTNTGTGRANLRTECAENKVSREAITDQIVRIRSWFHSFFLCKGNIAKLICWYKPWELILLMIKVTRSQEHMILGINIQPIQLFLCSFQIVRIPSPHLRNSHYFWWKVMITTHQLLVFKAHTTHLSTWHYTDQLKILAPLADDDGLYSLVCDTRNCKVFC